MPQRTQRTPRLREQQENNTQEEVSLIDIKAGFSIVGQQEQPGTHECMLVRLKIGNIEYKALLDTGINMNVMCQDIYRRIPSSEIYDQDECNFSLGGVSGEPVRIVKRISMYTFLYGWELGLNEFYILDKETDNHDIILGLQFMKDNKITLHPHRQSIEQRFSKDHSRKVFLETKGKQIKRIYRGEELVATEEVKLKTNEPSIIKVTWKENDVKQGQQDKMFIDGEGAHFKVKRSIHVFDGILDPQKMIICVQPKVGKNYQNHRIKQGDIVAKAYSILQVKVANQENQFQKWTKQEIYQELDFGKVLTPDQRRRALELCWKHRETISRDGTDIGVSRLPPFKIELSKNTPIYQKPRHFPPPVTEEIEKQCQDLYRLDLIEESESPWNSPIVPVRKPDGTLRICIDYRKVN